MRSWRRSLATWLANSEHVLLFIISTTDVGILASTSTVPSAHFGAPNGPAGAMEALYRMGLEDPDLLGALGAYQTDQVRALAGTSMHVRHSEFPGSATQPAGPSSCADRKSQAWRGR